MMRRDALRVLAYHRVLPRAQGPTACLSATAEDFELHVRHLATAYEVVGLEDLLAAQRGVHRLPRRAVLLTFDDAYVDFGTVVWPILRHYGLPGAVFVPTEFPGDRLRAFWWDRLYKAVHQGGRQPLSRGPLAGVGLTTPGARSRAYRTFAARIKAMPHADAMNLVNELVRSVGGADVAGSDVLDWEQLRRISAEGASVVAHSRSHSVLTHLEGAAARAEIAGSMDDIQREIGVASPVFCYPFGIHNSAVAMHAAEVGVEIAFTCLDGHNDLPTREPLRLRRTEITPRTTPGIFKARLWRPTAYFDMWRHRGKYRGADRPTADAGAVGRDGPPVKIAYVMSRFPKVSETFVLNEIIAVDELGGNVEVFPLLRERQPVSHPEAKQWTQRARFHPFASIPILRANLHFLRRAPATYIRTLAEVLRGTAGSLNFFLGALGIFPKTVRMAYEARALGVTHVHSHFANHPALAAFIIGRLTGIPFSFTAHGSDLHVDRTMLRQKVAAAAFVVTVSEYNRRIIATECGTDTSSRLHVVRCGVDPRGFSPPSPRPPRGVVEIACVASLEEVKGHRFLIDACAILRDHGVPFRCHLVGDGPMRGAVRQQVDSLGLAAHVVVHGSLARPQVVELLRSADVAVLASHPTRTGKKEGVPVALMEAMACELPVVASAISGIPELVEDGATGILVESGDAVALAGALERLAADPALRSRLGRAGRQRILEDYELRTNAARLLALIRNATESRNVQGTRRIPVAAPRDDDHARSAAATTVANTA